MELRLDGKVALVTGGSRGIGRAIAAHMAQAGAVVMISSRKEEDLKQAAKELSADGASVEYFVANAGEPDQAQSCVEATIERLGSLDILVNNAATNPYFGKMIEIDIARLQKTAQVNQEAVLVWSQLAYSSFMESHGGCILNVASIGGMSVERGIGWYNVTKSAVIQTTRQLAFELGPSVRVNALAPGLVKTDFARALWEPAGDAVAARLPLRRIGEPDDIGKAALFLASDAASWITGHVLVVDGGAMSMPSGGI